MYGKEYLDAKDKTEATERSVEAVNAILAEYEDIDAREAIARRICPDIDLSGRQNAANMDYLRARNAYANTPLYAMQPANVSPLFGGFWPFN